MAYCGLIGADIIVPQGGTPRHPGCRRLGGSESSSGRCREEKLLVTANIVSSSLILLTLVMEAIHSCETSVLTRATGHNIPEGGILHSHSRENLKYYIVKILAHFGFRTPDLSVVQHVASRYTDCATSAPQYTLTTQNFCRIL
jgi:hypothetical protein